MDFDSLPSNVQVEVLSYVANDRNVSWPDLLRLRKTSRIFNVELLKQLTTAKIAETDYDSTLRKPCWRYSPVSDNLDRLTSDFFIFLPKISHALTEIYFPCSVVHSAALAHLTIAGTLQTADFIHLVVCSADCFTFIDNLSQITPCVETLILEHTTQSWRCSGCVPHQLSQLWSAIYWNHTQLKKLALVMFDPERQNGCCAAWQRGIILDPRIYNCNNLITLDLRGSGLRSVSLGSFPLLEELRVGLDSDDNNAGNDFLRQVTACSNLKFLEIQDSYYCGLDDTFSINQLQLLTRLTHLHIAPSDEVAFAAFFRNPQIQLQKVTIFLSDDEVSLISDVIEGNPGLQVLAVDAYCVDEDISDYFDALPGLSDLKSLVVVLKYPGEPPSNSFFSLLDPIVHSKLQVAALVCQHACRHHVTRSEKGATFSCKKCTSSYPDLVTGIIEPVQRRFAGHHVNGRPVEILGARPRKDGDGIYKRIVQNCLECACCVEPLTTGKAFNFFTSWN